MKLVSLIIAFAAHGGWATQAASTSNDPQTYFGGSENEGYTAWLDAKGAASYTKSAFIASTQQAGAGVALHWSIEGDSIQLAVAAQATGWAAFGIGESGAMLGADIIMYSAESNTLVDSYVLDQPVMPMQDDCQSWTLVNSTVDGGFIIFEATRLLNSSDTQDRILSDDSDELIPPTRVLTAWGDSVEPSYHGPNNARGTIRFFGNSSSADALQAFAMAMEREAQGNFTVRANNYEIPTNLTTYAVFCASRADIEAQGVDLNQDLHTIGIEAFIDPRTTRFVHHYTVAASANPWNSSLPCSTYMGFEIAYVWAPGDVPLTLPANVGSPLGLTGFQSFKLEIHYDNPEGIAGQIDNSGIRLYYTNQKREFDLGVLQTGDPFLSMMGTAVSPNKGLVQHTFDCPSSCSANYTTQELTVIREHLHMHATGVSMVNAQIRDGDVIRQGQVEYWDFRQQGNLAVVQSTFNIQPGDAFRTICNYNANRNETWGKASSEEMCIAFLFYYPRQIVEVPFAGTLSFMCGVNAGMLLPGCDSEYVMTPDFSEVRQLGRVFGTASEDGTCTAVPTLAPEATPISNSDAPSDTPSISPNANSPAPSGGPTGNGTSAVPSAGPNATSAVPSADSNATSAAPSAAISNASGTAQISATNATNSNRSSTSTSAAATTATGHFLGATVLSFVALAMWY